MNSKQAEQKLRQLMKRKTSMSQRGRLLAHLLNELNVESDSNRSISTTIERALEKLERDGIIKLTRTGSVLNGYEVTARGARELAGKKRTAASRKGPAQSEVAEAMPSPDATTESVKLTRAEMVTLALHALQEKADERGLLHVSSSVLVIAEALSISESEASELNRPLAELGLRKSPRGRNDDGKRPHWVNREITEVTEEMLSQSGTSDAEQPTNEQYDHQLLEIIADLERQLAEALGNTQAADALVEVISGLEAREAELIAQVAELEAAKLRGEQLLEEGAATLRRLSESNERLQQELRDVKDRLSHANAQLLLQAAPSPEVRSVLERYGKKVPPAPSRR